MIKVAGYCRVSTDKEDQANSFDAQKRYFQQYIESYPHWTLHEIYADEGISGTGTKKRTQFNRMISDAYEGCFSLIVTKEVSRFSRNILDTISYTRELKRSGVAVLFLNDGINTMDADAELRLSIMASIAQEESRKTSDRVTWGQTRQMERGVVFGTSMLGYDVKGGKIYVESEGAQLVKLIFYKYAVEQMGTTAIARFLTEKGYRTYKGGINWTSSSVVRILKNEKYVGDLVQRKTYTADYLTHEKRINHGHVPKIEIKDHHQPIVSRELWELAQQKRRQNHKHGASLGGHSDRYIFSGKIKCAQCGSSFVSRQKTLNDGTKVRRWSCYKSVAQGSACCDIGRLVRDDDAQNMLKTAFMGLKFDREEVIQSVTGLVLDVINNDMDEDSVKNIQFEIQRIEKKRLAVMDCYFSEDITKEDMLAMVGQYDIQLEQLKARKQKAQESDRTAENTKSSLEMKLGSLLACETESAALYKNLLDSLTVYKDKHMELRIKYLEQVFHFR